MIEFDLFDLIVVAVIISMMPLVIDLLNTFAPNQFGRVAQGINNY